MTLTSLRALVEKATIKNWRVEMRPQYGATVWGPCGKNGSFEIARCGHAPFDEANAALIVALHNNAEALVAVAEVAANRPNKFEPHYMIWQDKLDAALRRLGGREMRKLTPEEIAAMWLWGEEYAQSSMGAVTWWTHLPANRKRVVREFVKDMSSVILPAGRVPK